MISFIKKKLYKKNKTYFKVKCDNFRSTLTFALIIESDFIKRNLDLKLNLALFISFMAFAIPRIDDPKKFKEVSWIFRHLNKILFNNLNCLA